MTQPDTESLEIIRIPAASASASKIACDGGGGVEAGGHPLVYLNPGADGRVVCPYCGRVFIVEQGDA